ncbi:MAG: gliding motility-associated C-terminal domain-containing protein [Pedobacter sp.]|nr:MAG: gliding motility-associated C-terminal domain-containing protein [Pedobacter sp.]
MIFRLIFFVSLYLLILSGISINAREKISLADPLTLADFIVVNASCNATGSIEFKNANPAGITFSWEDETAVTIGTTYRIERLKAGTYKLTYTINGGPAYVLSIPILSALPYAATQDILLGCGENIKRIHGDAFSTTEKLMYKWEDVLNRVIATTEFVNLTAGQYYLTVTDGNNCSSTRASIVVKAASKRPSINPNSIVITSSGCSSPNGSITGLKVTSSEDGPYTYRWTNGAGDVVGTQLDLVGVPAGKYRLSARLTAGDCETLSSELIVEQDNPIVSSTSSFVSKPADCNMPNGAITGVKTNATSFKWIDVNGNTVATTLDMVNVKEGYYELIVSNNSGCQETLGPFHVKAGNPPIILQSQPIIKNDSCNLGIGSIIGSRVVGSGIRYRWTDLDNKEISTDPDLRNINAGTYLLAISNTSCTNVYHYEIQNMESQLAAPILEDKFVCSPTDILITFSETAPLYRIYDQNNNLLKESKNKSFMLNVKESSNYYGSLGRGSCESLRTAFKVTVGETAINIPTSFSPNNDGINDTWILKGIELYNTADVKVFNRYGAMVYQSTNPSNLFDGKKEGNDLPSGVYYYIIKLTNDCNPFTGSLTLLR